MKSSLSLALILVVSFSCNTSDQSVSQDPNPPCEGFDIENSDPKAIEIADRIMEAQGGREAWDNLSIVSWSFFGRRDLIWNKQTGDVRIESPRDSLVYLYNLFSKEGKVGKNGVEIVDSTRSMLLKRAESIWINDGYWLFMPFKLKDTGVTLNYIDEDTTQNGDPSFKLSLKFKDIGDTPQNKYNVWVDKSDYLIKQWAYFRNAEQDTANFIRPWDNYKTTGRLKLSFDRTDNSGPRGVRIFEKVPNEVFTSLQAITLN